MLSLSARRAWIEILCAGILRLWACVALRKESVDRNSIALVSFRASTVALRKESVDRNRCPVKRSIGRIKSLSARRAWIEISMLCSAGK